MGGWREGWETIGYDAPIGTLGDGYRVRIRTERGQVVRYTVQFEVWIEERFRPAIRYDTAHGVPHRDTLDWAGRVIEKEFFPDKSSRDALEDAIDDVKANWRRHREAFERRR